MHGKVVMLEFILVKILIWAATLCTITFLIWCLYCLYDCIRDTYGFESVILTIIFIFLCIIILLGIVIGILNGTAKEILL